MLKEAKIREANSKRILKRIDSLGCETLSLCVCMCASLCLTLPHSASLSVSVCFPAAQPSTSPSLSYRELSSSDREQTYRLTERTMAEMNCEQQQVSVDALADMLFFPPVLEYLPFSSLSCLPQICRSFYERTQSNRESGGYWQYLCVNFAKRHGLYHHCVRGGSVRGAAAAKLHIKHDLLPLRHKWLTGAKAAQVQRFRVRTMCRFRPGTAASGRVLLPLHQFLKLRRERLQQLYEASDGNRNSENCNTSIATFGKQFPEEFVDAISGTVMKEPVRLSGASERVIDRGVAMQCITNTGQDPFSGERLTAAMLVPLPELQVRIATWAKLNVNNDPTVDVVELQSLVELGNEIDPTLLEALIDVQQLSALSDKIYIKGKFNDKDPIASRANANFILPNTGDNVSNANVEGGGDNYWQLARVW